jgi:hypothetical protein
MALIQAEWRFVHLPRDASQINEVQWWLDARDTKIRLLKEYHIACNINM